MALKKYDYLLFDIGGVLVELCGAPKILEWLGNRVSYEEMRSMWTHSDAVRSYEKGLISSEDFAERVVEELQFDISKERFLEEFVLFIKCLYPGMPELMKDLAEEYSLACLSNTNELHWKRMCDEFGFDKIIKKHFLSFRIGSMKPEQEIYRHVIDELSCEPCKILFFDDNRPNVDAAICAGMDAVHVKDFNDMKRKLHGMGIIHKY